MNETLEHAQAVCARRRELMFSAGAASHHPGGEDMVRTAERVEEDLRREFGADAGRFWDLRDGDQFGLAMTPDGQIVPNMRPRDYSEGAEPSAPAFGRLPDPRGFGTASTQEGGPDAH